MRKGHWALAALLLSPLVPAFAADVDVRVMIYSDVAPGVYGRVDLRGAPPPPVVYAEPRIIVRQVRAKPVEPIYLHVPPGHAKDWGKHCRKYGACNVPVYFVNSDEYKPKKAKKEKKEKKEKKDKHGD